jgi:hypothetical protein
MRKLKNFIKSLYRTISKLIPHNVKVIIRNIFAELSGTREMRDAFNQYFGDFEVYNKYLKDKTHNTEYQVDKIIRTIGTDIEKINSKIDKLEKELNLKKHE